ncbi:MAG TPA: SdpI family protein [Flavobacteriaceae bacterium]|nr:SdpI family protein [Flavobacteriaceae bacterium]
MTLLLLLGSSSLIFFLAGFILYKFPPKEINSLYGYRTANSMSSRERWDFSQNYSAKLMMKSALLMGVISAIALLMPIGEILQLVIGTSFLILFCVMLFLKTEREIKKRFAGLN